MAVTLWLWLDLPAVYRLGLCSPKVSDSSLKTRYGQGRGPIQLLGPQSGAPRTGKQSFGPDKQAEIREGLSRIGTKIVFELGYVVHLTAQNGQFLARNSSR